MTNEVINAWGTLKTLEAGGASTIPNASVVGATTFYDTVADGANFPDGVFTITCTFAVAPTKGATISLYARDLGTDGESDSPVPDAARPGRIIGSFKVDAVTSLQTLKLVGLDLPQKATYYLHNNGTAQAIGTGWTLKVKPRTYKVNA